MFSHAQYSRRFIKSVVVGVTLITGITTIGIKSIPVRADSCGDDWQETSRTEPVMHWKCDPESLTRVPDPVDGSKVKTLENPCEGDTNRTTTYKIYYQFVTSEIINADTLDETTKYTYNKVDEETGVIGPEYFYPDDVCCSCGCGG